MLIRYITNSQAKVLNECLYLETGTLHLTQFINKIIMMYLQNILRRRNDEIMTLKKKTHSMGIGLNMSGITLKKLRWCQIKSISNWNQNKTTKQVRNYIRLNTFNILKQTQSEHSRRSVLLFTENLLLKF